MSIGIGDTVADVETGAIIGNIIDKAKEEVKRIIEQYQVGVQLNCRRCKRPGMLMASRAHALPTEGAMLLLAACGGRAGTARACADSGLLPALQACGYMAAAVSVSGGCLSASFA